MAKMNLKRGLLRLWVVLSVGFVVLVAVERFEPLTNEFVDAPAHAESATDIIVSAEDAAASAQEAADSAAKIGTAAEGWTLSDESPSSLSAKRQEKRARLVAEYTNEEYAHAWADLRKTITLALGVPLLTLLFGVGVWWAAAGLGWKPPVAPTPGND